MPTVFANLLGIGLASLTPPSAIVDIASISEFPSISNQPVASIEQNNLFLAPNLEESETPITSVSELSSVQPHDWVFQAWQSLSQRYKCSAGDTHSPGDRILSRQEFAAILNTCLDRVSKLIVAAPESFTKQEDLATWQRLQGEFSFELAAIRGRLDPVETQIPKLERSLLPTTKLTGEVVLAISAANGGTKTDDDEQIDNNLGIGSRVRLNFDTSFTGEDRLRIRLQSTNTPSFSDATGTDMARLSVQGDDENEVKLSVLEYRLPITEQATVYIELVGGGLDDFTDTLNPLLSGSGRGSISRFGQRNPIYRQSGGAGAGINYDFGEAASLSLGYLGFNTPTEDEVDSSESDDNGNPYGAIVQLTLQPLDNFELGLTYVRSYNDLETGTGSKLANDPFDDQSDRIRASSYGLELTWQVSPVLTLGGWAGYTKARAEDLLGEPEASIFNYAVTLAFPDLGKQGNLAGIAIGQPPKTSSNELGAAFRNRDTSLHLEAFYRFQATDNITITPGLLVITNPEHNKNNDTIYVGTIRTTFSF